MGIIILIVLVVIVTLLAQHYRQRRQDGRVSERYRSGTILDETPRTKEERHHEILSILRKHENEPVSRSYLARALDVSSSTVKKDMAQLAKKGYIRFVKKVGNDGAIYKINSRVAARKVTR